MPKLDKILDECVHHKQIVEHTSWVGDVKPNCMTCDGYGFDAKKNNWNCYDQIRRHKMRIIKYKQKGGEIK